MPCQSLRKVDFVLFFLENENFASLIFTTGNDTFKRAARISAQTPDLREFMK